MSIATAVDANALSEPALSGLIEEFVTRDGTDYGAQEPTLDNKKNAILAVTQKYCFAPKSRDFAGAVDPATLSEAVRLQDAPHSPSALGG